MIHEYPQKGVYMITFKHRGNFSKTEKFLNKARETRYLSILDRYGNEGVNALSSTTPIDSGRTATSWAYRIERTSKSTSIIWYNTNENQGVNIALILQYGHGTGTGGFVRGTDYINPAMKPIFDRLAEEAWREVTSA